ncbi:MAG: hypothetical protein ACYDBB_19325 [Armatimonadota bacterium]
MSLHGSIVATADLAPAERDRMFTLLQAYFSGTDREVFERDLLEKPWTICLHDPQTGLLHGFSTLCLMDELVDEIPVRAFFSGDTIIDRPYWGSMELERVWFRFLFSRIDAEPQYRWYWFLICKGYRTYRYLPVFFHRYYPSPEATPPFEQMVLDRLAHCRFGDQYDPATGIIRCQYDYRLRPGIGDIAERELRDPRIAFFQQRNPGWVDGTELACLTELSYPNIKRMGLRILGKEAVS